jgi:hypothetical protein
MDQHQRPQIELSIDLHRGLYFAIIMDLYEWPHTPLTISLLLDLYLTIRMDWH